METAKTVMRLNKSSLPEASGSKYLYYKGYTNEKQGLASLRLVDLNNNKFVKYNKVNCLASLRLVDLNIIIGVWLMNGRV